MSNAGSLVSALAALKTAVIASILIAVVAGGLALAFPRHAELLTQIDIDAPPEAVWSVLMDTKEFGAWNPEIAALHGALAPGATVSVVEIYDGVKQTFHPTIQQAEPGKELRWRGVVGSPEILVAEHYFELQPKGGGTHFLQGESLRGAALWLFDPERLPPYFDAMNRALKRRVEGGARPVAR